MLDEREWDNMFLQEKVKEINEKLNALKDISHVAISKVNALANLFGVKIGQIFFE